MSGRPRRRKASDSHSGKERLRGRARTCGKGAGEARRRHRHQIGQAARRRKRRYVLLLRRARAHQKRNAGGAGRRDTDIKRIRRERKRRRARRLRIPQNARHRRRVRDNAQPSRLSVGHRAREGSGGVVRQRMPYPDPEGHRTRRSHLRLSLCHDLVEKVLALFGKGNKKRTHRAVAALDAYAPPRRGRKADKQHRRYNELRHARIRSADARL